MLTPLQFGRRLLPAALPRLEAGVCIPRLTQSCPRGLGAEVASAPRSPGRAPGREYRFPAPCRCRRRPRRPFPPPSCTPGDPPLTAAARRRAENGLARVGRPGAVLGTVEPGTSRSPAPGTCSRSAAWLQRSRARPGFTPPGPRPSTSHGTQQHRRHWRSETWPRQPWRRSLHLATTHLQPWYAGSAGPAGASLAEHHDAGLRCPGCCLHQPHPAEERGAAVKPGAGGDGTPRPRPRGCPFPASCRPVLTP